MSQQQITVTKSRRGTHTECPCGWSFGSGHPFAVDQVQREADFHALACDLPVMIVVTP